MMYDGILLKPQLDDLYLKHFNPNHDPKSGQFTTGSGGAFSAKKYKKKYDKILRTAKTDEEKDIKLRKLDEEYAKPKPRKIYSIAMLEKDVKTGRRELTADEWRILSTNQVKWAEKKNPGFEKWYGEKDPNYENYDVKNPEKHVEDFKKWKDGITQTIKQNDQKISKSIASDMIKDFDRWGSEDNSKDYFFKIDGKQVTKEKMQKHLEQQISKRIKEIGSKPFDMEVYDFKHAPNIIGVQINGIKEYSNGAPLSIEYDTKKKKIDYWGYS